MARHRRDVIVNVPFDDDYVPMFEALVFGIIRCGYRVRCGLEDDDSGNIRLERLIELIKESPRSIHDISRVKVGRNGLPRFNMPFELGLALGEKRFSRRSHAMKIMVAKPYQYPKYISDLAGNDPAAHSNKPAEVLRIVRRFLHVSPAGRVLPGAGTLVASFRKFNAGLPRMADRFEIESHEIGVLSDYRTFVHCVTEFVSAL